MPSIYLAVDFSYNPHSRSPLKIFEIADAFTSGWNTKPVGNQRISTYEYFINDLQKQYPGALLVQVDLSGLTLVDLAKNTEILTYDTNALFNNDIKCIPPSSNKVTQFVIETIKRANKRDNNSRILLIHARHPFVYLDMDEALEGFKDTRNIKFVHSPSKRLQDAFYNKKIFHDVADGNPLYPETIHFLFGESNQEIKVNTFKSKAHADFYVIKPFDGTRSEGVHVVPATDLLETLQRIERGEIFPELYISRRQFTGVLIQACHLSQLIKFNNKQHFGKGRAIIRVDFNDQADMPTLHFITGYWQVAHSPFQGEVNDQTVIACSNANPEGVLEIDMQDWRAITELLSMHMPSILKEMFVSDQKYRQLHAANCFTLPFREKPYEDVVIDFLKSQVFIPSIPRSMQQLYYWMTRSVDSSANDEIIKCFVMDMAGVNQAHKALVRCDIQPIPHFVSSIMATMEDERHYPFNKSVTFLDRSKSNTAFLILALIASIITDAMINRKIVALRFISPALSVLSALLVLELRSYYQAKHSRNCFFKMIELPRNEDRVFLAAPENTQPAHGFLKSRIK